MTPSNHQTAEDRRALRLRNAIRRLLNSYGADDIFWTLNQELKRRTEPPKKVGQPKFFDEEALMHVWVYVRKMMRLHRLSAIKACRQGSFSWIQGGGGRVKVLRTIRGATLRRRYQEAEAFIRRESEVYWFLEQGRLIGRGEQLIRTPSPTEAWWNKLLDEQLREEGLCEKSA